ncbi:MAG: hypothetical protein Q4F23_01150 [Coriobacteriia bacterium]|nr:hypothetical protein [Coriobacteriia bacterium]
MKTNNYVLLAISALAAAFLLFLWYYLGFNSIDSPLDLVLAILWWVGIVVIAVVIMRLEHNRRRQIRTIYVSPTALYNSERGVVGIAGVAPVDAMRDLLTQLKYNFDKEELPSRDTFDYRFVVQTDEFKEGDQESGQEPTWKGTVTKIDRKNGNREVEFEDEAQLRQALMA